MNHNQWVRMGVDFAAPIAFAAAFAITRDFQAATAVLVVASVIALSVGWLIEKRLAFLPLLAGGFAVVFGALTLVLHDPSFVKMKMTFVNLTFAGLCVVVGFFRTHWIKTVLGDAIDLPEPAIRTLMIRYAIYFVLVAVVNEIVWRTQSNGVWVTFRVLLLPLALVFSFTQVPFMMKHMKTPPKEPTAPEPPDPGF